MIVGGYYGLGPMNSVELFNMQTSQSCIFGTLPYAVTGAMGGVFNGTPILCGGSHQVWPSDYNLASTVISKSNCYKYNNSWIPVIIKIIIQILK
jgi:hypothetical protein